MEEYPIRELEIMQEAKQNGLNILYIPTRGTLTVNQILQVKIYKECACTESKTATPGTCKMPCKNRIWISMALWLAGLIVNFAGFPAHAIVSQRIVSEADRTATQGLISSATKIFGKLPAPLIFGAILDTSCSVWRQSGAEKQGLCHIYDIDRFEEFYDNSN